MAAQTRSDLEFEVVYSIHLERMMDTLLGRIDRLSSFLQIFLGVAVVTELAPLLVGLVIAAIAAAQLVWQFGVKAGEAKASHDRWHNLHNKFNRLTDIEIEQEISQISDRDGRALSSLYLAAHISASIQLNLKHDEFPVMPKWQKFIAFCAGGMPILT